MVAVVVSGGGGTGATDNSSVSAHSARLSATYGV